MALGLVFMATGTKVATGYETPTDCFAPTSHSPALQRNGMIDPQGSNKHEIETYKVE